MNEREVRGPDISARSRQETLTGLTAEQGSATSCVEEEVFAFRHILDINLRATIHSRKDAGGKNIMSVRPIAAGCLGCWREPGIHSPCRCQELQAVPQADAHTVLRNFANGGVGDCNPFC